MAELKTKPTAASVKSFVAGIADEQQRADAQQVLKIMKEITGAQPRMWGASIVGFGDCHYVYASGREGDWFVTGFSPRKTALTLYFMAGLEQRFAAHLKKLGKFKTGMGCLYVKRLADIDLDVLRDMIKANATHMAEMGKIMAERARAKKPRKKI